MSVIGTVDAKRRRASAGVIAMALALGGLAACGSDQGGESSAKTTIRYTYATGDQTWNAVTEAVVDAFNEQSETTIVQLDPLPAGSDYSTALRTLDATGNWPAIIDMRDTVTYIAAGKLAPIPESVTELLSPEAYAASEDGNVYTLPLGALNGELGLNVVYNRDYFSEHSLDAPGTYDEWIDLMADIKANGDVPLGTAAGEIWPVEQIWKMVAAPYFASYPDGYWRAVADGSATIDDLREPLERLKYITDEFVVDGWQSTQDPQLTTLLVNDITVMITSRAGIGRLRDIDNVDPDFNVGMFVAPADDGNVYILKDDVNGDTAQGMALSSVAAADEDQLAAATEFLEFFYSVEAANIIEENGSLAPDLLRSDEIQRNTSIPGSEEFLALADAPNVHWYTNDTGMTTFGAFNSFFRQARIEYMDGQIDVDELIEKVQEEFDQAAADAAE